MKIASRIWPIPCILVSVCRMIILLSSVSSPKVKGSLNLPEDTEGRFYDRTDSHSLVQLLYSQLACSLGSLGSSNNIDHKCGPPPTLSEYSSFFSISFIHVIGVMVL